MAGSRRIEVQVLGDVASLGRALREGSSEIDRFGATASRSFTRVGASARGTSRGLGVASKAVHGVKIAGLAAIPVVGLLGYQLIESAERAAQSQQAHIRLRTAMKQVGVAAKGNIKPLEDVNTKLGLMAGIDDELVSDSMAQFIRATGSVAKATRLTGLAVDYARAKQVDLSSATETLIRIQAGSYRALKGLGIQYVASTTNVDKLKASTDHYTQAQLKQAQQADALANRQKVLDILQQKLKGSAEAYGKTAQGSLDRLNVAFDNIKETVGKALIPTITRLANRFSEWFVKAQKTGELARIVKRVQKDIDDLTASVGSLAHAMQTANNKIGGAVHLFQALENLNPAKWLVKYAQAAGSVANAFGRWLGPLQSIIDKLGAIISLASKVTDVLGGSGGSGPANVQAGRGAGAHAPGGRAHGGPVYSGQSYMVGERGRELFVPNTNGRIVPNDVVSAAGGGDWNVTINAPNARVLDRHFIQDLQRELNRLSARRA